MFFSGWVRNQTDLLKIRREYQGKLIENTNQAYYMNHPMDWYSSDIESTCSEPIPFKASISSKSSEGLSDTDSICSESALSEISISSESSEGLCETCEHEICCCKTEGIIDCILDKPFSANIDTAVLFHDQLVSLNPITNQQKIWGTTALFSKNGNQMLLKMHLSTLKIILN